MSMVTTDRVSGEVNAIGRVRPFVRPSVSTQATDLRPSYLVCVRDMTITRQELKIKVIGKSLVGYISPKGRLWRREYSFSSQTRRTNMLRW